MERVQDQDAVKRVLDPLPKRWRQDRLCNVAELRTSNVDKKSVDGEQTVQLCNYLDVYRNDKISNEIDFMQATASENDIIRFSLEVDDVIITKDSESPDDIGIPAIISESVRDLVCGYHLTILRPIVGTIHGRYLFYAVASRFSAYQFYLAANGVTRFGLTYQGTKNLRIAFPEEVEQQKIADFLDWKTGQIDGLISKKKQLIEKLKEKRIALITKAVTKGLNPDTPMRDSGIPWLGEVPKHWEVRRLKFLASIRYGLGEPPEYVDEGLNFVRATDVSQGTIERHAFKKIRSEDVPWNKNPSLCENEIIVVRSGAYTGDSAIIPKDLEGSIAGFDMVVTATDIKPEILAWALLSRYLLEAQIYQTRLRAAQPHLNSEELGNFFVVVPAISEQPIIAEYVKKNVRQLDEMVNIVEEIIDRLTEYRIALITDATTGKIDVRNVKIGDAG